MRSNQNNTNENLGRVTEGPDQQALHNDPLPTTSNQSQIMSGFSSAISPGELQSSYEAIDPWFLYGGNIAAACQATNAVVEVHQRTRDETKAVDDDDKRKQRANSRLTAWQSRERKRIEFEVLQEREAELKSRNLELMQENQQLKMIIGSFKANTMSSRDNITTNEQRRDRDVLRLQQKGVPTSSSQTSRHLSRNVEDIQQQFSLQFQNRTALGTSNVFRMPSTNAPFSTDTGSTTPSAKIPETRGSRDLMFSLEPDPMTGIAPFPSTIDFSSNRDANGRMISSSINDEGSSLGGGMPQHMRGDMGGYSALGMNALPGSSSGNFLYNTNDMLAPTIFAPLFRGDSTQEQSVNTTVNSHVHDMVGQNSNRQLLFGSSLPFLSSFSGGQGAGSSNFSANLSSYLRSASLAEEKVDVPLFRAIRTGRSQSQQPPQSQAQKRKRSLPQGKEDGIQASDHEDTTPKNAYARLSSSMTRDNVGVTGSKAYSGGGLHGSELLFSDDNVVEASSLAPGDAFVSSLSNSNVHNNEDGDES